MSDSPLALEHESALEHPSPLQHHFATMDQQRDASSLGMWLFLGTEVMFFGGMFCAYLIYRYWYFNEFAIGSRSISLWTWDSQYHCSYLQQFDGGVGGTRGADGKAKAADHSAASHHGFWTRIPWNQRNRVVSEV